MNTSELIDMADASTQTFSDYPWIVKTAEYRLVAVDVKTKRDSAERRTYFYHGSRRVGRARAEEILASYAVEEQS